MFASKQHAESGHIPNQQLQEKKPFILYKQGMNAGRVQRKENTTTQKAAQASVKNHSIEVGFSAFIPNTLNAPVYKHNKAWKREPNPFSSKLFSSDDRSYKQAGSSRIFQKGTIQFANTTVTNRTSYKTVGASEQADPVLKIIGYTPINYGSGVGGNPITQITGIKNIKKKTAPDKGSVTNIYSSGIKGFNFIGEAAYPFSSVAPDIDFDVKAYVHVIEKDNDYYALVSLFGTRNNFPAYEGYVGINGKKHYMYQYKVDKNDGPGMVNLNSSTAFSRFKQIKL